MDLSEIKEILCESEGVVSADIEGEDQPRLRVELATEADASLFFSKAQLLTGYVPARLGPRVVTIEAE